MFIKRNTEKKEEEVGITQRTSKFNRFQGLIKERYSDFHVHEIDLNNHICKLTDLKPPVDNVEPVDNLDEGIIAKIDNFEEISAKIKTLKRLAKSKDNENVEINVTNLNKDERTKIHRWISSLGNLKSQTIDKNDNLKFILISSAFSKSMCKRRPSNRAKFTHMFMYKEGLDTSDAIAYLAKKLNMRATLICYAGIKDRQAKTTQRISIPNGEPKKLVFISNNSRNMKLGNFEFKEKPLHLGELAGNHFKIMIKDVKSIDIANDLNLSGESLKNEGFINYYGLQRFGTFNILTHTVGKAVIQNKWIEAFDMILSKKTNDQDFMTKLKSIWLEKREITLNDLKILPKWLRSIESNLLFGLAKRKSKNDYLGPFNNIPRNVRLLYIHAFQSYLWNKVASYRIKEYGFKPIIGDLVYEDNSKNSNVSGNSNLEQGYEMNADDTFLEPEAFAQKVIVLTEENLSNYSVTDVLIPIYGKCIQLPNNSIKNFYNDILEEEGVDADQLFNNFDTAKGSYRKLLVIPKDVKWEIMNYCEKDNSDNFIKSDLDLIKNNKFTEEDHDCSKEKTGVIFEFSLPSSSYATMALREVLMPETEDSPTEAPKEAEDSPASETTVPEKTISSEKELENSNISDNPPPAKKLKEEN